ncbi:MAG TPA: hypothetical protein VGK61_01915 [Planctomycetota bacterium]|jgi:hypothetical protein
MRVLVLAAALALLAGCGRKPDPPAPAGKPAPPELPALADVRASEDFASDEFVELPPGGPAAFGWDLGQDVHHYYSCEEESFALLTTSARGESTKIHMRSRNDGGAEFVGGGNGRGELFYKSAPRAQWINDEAVSSEELNKIRAVVYRCLVREDGGFTESRKLSGDTNYPMLDVYFALPGRGLEPGGKDTREIHVDAGAEDFKYHGRQEIVHAGRRKVGRFECVKLLSKVDVDLTPPFDGHGRLVGWIAGYFDSQARRFVRVDASLALAADLRKLMRPQDPTIEPFWNLVSTQFHTRVTLKLKD